MHHDTILVIDFGSQYTQLIARRIRELGVYSEILPCTTPLATIAARRPKGLVLSGGPSSVYDEGAPSIDPAIYELGCPVLGICYGAQLTAKLLGGHVTAATHREYGRAEIAVERGEGVLAALPAGTTTSVWMSHGDHVERVPEGFVRTASSANCPWAAFHNDARRIYCLQFHPEVVHTARGKDIISAFTLGICQAAATWSMASFVDAAIANIRQQVGDRGKVIMGLSGGVDSSIAAALLHRAIGDRLVCIFVDNGLLRQDERHTVEATYRKHFPVDLRVVDATGPFLEALAGLTDPEQKRKAIGRVFIEVFEQQARKIEGAAFLGQGTLYPDVIESVSFKGPSVVIKSHHNVGGLPERMKLALVEPLRELFKDEVRALGETLGVPHEMVWRQPFPGPGLAVRCIGEVTAPRLDVLRRADAIIEQEIRKAGLYDKIWQSFGVLLPVKSVGVMGDARTYEEVLSLRAVTSQDGMTADWVPLPYEVLGAISTRIINEVRGINRVLYDITSKPPGTIEWE